MNHRTLSILAAGILLFCPVSGLAEDNTPVTKQAAPSQQQIAAIERKVFQLVNQHRRSKGLPALTLGTKTSAQARTHSSNMARKQVPFGHDGFSQRLQAIGIPFKSAAENVAANGGFADPAQQAMTSWLNSPGHKRNIEGRAFNLTGVGVSFGNGQYYFTQIFIAR